MDKNYEKVDSAKFWGLDVSDDSSVFFQAVKKKFNTLFLLKRCEAIDLNSNPISKLQHIKIVQLKGCVRYVFPLQGKNLIFDLSVKGKKSSSLLKNNIEEKTEVLLNAEETLLIPFGAIFYQEIVTGPVEFYELSEEDICYREMVTFCGKTILGLNDFESRSFEKFDPEMVSGHSTNDNLIKFSKEARLFESIVKLGKTKRSNNTK